MNKKILPVALVLAVVVAALATWAWFSHRPGEDPNRLVLYGNVDLRQVSLAFKASERIAQLRVTEGDHVRAGQVLGVLDTRTALLHLAQADAQIGVQEQALRRLRSGSRPEEIAQARAAVAAAQADADLAEQQVMRLQAIRQTTAGRAVSQQDLDAALARRKVAQAQLENARKAAQLAVAGPRKEDTAQAAGQLEVARAGRALLRQQLDDAELKAPIDAVVRARLLEPGDIASPQRPAFTLAITQPKWVRAYVAETRLGRVRPGMAAAVTTDSEPGRQLAGRVGYISSVAEFTPKTVQTEELRTSLVYEVRILVEDPQDSLRLGMPATVHLQLEPLGAAPGGAAAASAPPAESR